MIVQLHLALLEQAITVHTVIIVVDGLMYLMQPSQSVVSGTKGFLDIKGIYYQSGNLFGWCCLVWYTGLQRSTNAPQTPVITSKQVLTAITKVFKFFKCRNTVAVGDIVKQDSTGAFGIVETAVTGGTLSINWCRRNI